MRIQEDGKGAKICTLVDQGKPCGTEEPVFLPPLGYWESFVGGFWSSPMLPEQAGHFIQTAAATAIDHDDDNDDEHGAEIFLKK